MIDVNGAMGWQYPIVLLIVYLSYFDVTGTSLLQQEAKCPCLQEEYCNPISKNVTKEIFIFSLTNKSEVWMGYDWTKITTIVMVGYVSLDLMCFAHKHGARVVTIANYRTDELTNSTARTMWVKTQLQTVRRNFLDGINIDYEDAIPQNATELRDSYTDLIQETYRIFKHANKHYQVTVDVAWSPGGIDERFYDYLAISAYVDFLFVMSYDEQSQIFGQCVARANSPFFKTLYGIADYFILPVPRHKLVLGVPWYGYVYPCTRVSEDHKTCYIHPVPFRGVNCSDAAGRQYDFSYITQILLPKASAGRHWDNSSYSPFFNYTENGAEYQVRYDDPESLTLKYKLAIQLNLRGVGMWNADAVDSIHDPKGTKLMWEALPVY